MQELRVIEDDDWVDLDLGIASYRTHGTEAHLFSVRAVHNGVEIGFELGIPMSWDFQTPDDVPDGMGMYVGGIAIANMTSNGDRFLALLGQLWGQVAERSMSPLIEVQAVILKGSPDQVLTSELAMKVFFGTEDDSPNPYAELYINIDYAQRVVQFHEKDPEYRAGVLAGLADFAPNDTQ